MKKLIGLVICSLGLATSAFAGTATVKMHITGATANNNYFLYLSSESGALSIKDGDQGRSYPIDSGSVGQMMLVSLNGDLMTHETLPASCKVNLKDNQTLTVSGNIVKAGNVARIANLRCSVA